MKKKQNILLVEDDPNLGVILQESLEIQGFAVMLCKDGVEGWEVFKREKFDLCLVDVMLPKKDGFTLTSEIRNADQKIPILFLTAKSMKEDRIQGFKIGGDDYITKPFSMEELVLRIQAVLKRSGCADSNQPEITEFKIGDFVFNYEKHILMYNKKEQKLTHKEAELLRLLCLSQNKILDRDTALCHIWGEAGFFTGRSMDVYISKLRKYLESDRQIEIKNIHGKGFILKTS